MLHLINYMRATAVGLLIFTGALLCARGAVAAGPNKAALTRLSQQEKAAATELPEMVVELEPGADPEQFAADNGFTLVRRMRSNPNACVFNTTKAPSPQLTQAERKAKIETDKRVRKAFVNHRLKLVKYGFTPNDPYFHHNTPTSSYDGEWHLINEIGTGIDVRVEDAWDADFTGSGVVLATVDDGLQIDHPDLSPHYRAADSWNFGANIADPSPATSVDTHGTMTAGAAAAAGGNSVGICGAAPLASLSCLRLDFNTNPSTEADVADADMYHSSGANKSIKIKNHSYGYSEPWYDLPLERTALATSAAAGTIHVFSAGNGRYPSDPAVTADANKAMYQNLPEVIAVAAVDQDGIVKNYSSFGACVFVSAPAGILTTDRTGSAGDNAGLYFPDSNYIDGAEGTSFSAPIVSGVLALVKQAQPALDVRFAKHLIVRCSDVVDPNDATTESGGGWKTNAAGFKFNENYGFGLINAKKLVAMAQECTGASMLRTESTGTIASGASIPDNSSTGLTVHFAIGQAAPLEEMVVTLNITHTYIGDLEAYLTSPRGTTSRLFIANAQDATKNLSWTLLSNAFWGEDPEGTWSLNIRDLARQDTGTLVSYSATARMGYLMTPTAAPLLPYE